MAIVDRQGCALRSLATELGGGAFAEIEPCFFGRAAAALMPDGPDETGMFDRLETAAVPEHCGPLRDGAEAADASRSADLAVVFFAGAAGRRVDEPIAFSEVPTSGCAERSRGRSAPLVLVRVLP